MLVNRFKCNKNTLKKTIAKFEQNTPKLNKTNRTGRTKSVLPFLLLVNGLSLGFLLGNPYFIPILGAGFYSLPFLFHRNFKQNNLKPALTAITKNYILNKNIKSSIESCMSTIPDQYRGIFRHFLDLPIVEGICYLKKSLSVPYVGKWCDMLLLCQNEFSLHPLLLDVLQRQSEMEITITAYNEKWKFVKVIYMLMVILICSVYLASSLFLADCKSFFQSVQGQKFIALNMAVFFICLNGIWLQGRRWAD